MNIHMDPFSEESKKLIKMKLFEIKRFAEICE